MTRTRKTLVTAAFAVAFGLGGASSAMADPHATGGGATTQDARAGAATPLDAHAG
ncbi:hypothetical protein ABZ565_09880 [Streptomyces sp. NPDC016469]|uniref:hypothetical protein n=1 Tax=Streptomyces sp. NPDC016469 TaxID=3157191 RepID=UPI003410C6F4